MRHNTTSAASLVAMAPVNLVGGLRPGRGLALRLDVDGDKDINALSASASDDKITGTKAPAAERFIFPRWPGFGTMRWHIILFNARIPTVWFAFDEYPVRCAGVICGPRDSRIRKAPS